MISNLCEGSEEESEIDNYKNFEVDIQTFNETLFPRLTLKIRKFTVNFLTQYSMLWGLIKHDLKINATKKSLKKY